VVKFLRAGLTSKEIAERLEIGVSTVATYRKSLCMKLKVNSTAGLIAAASNVTA